MLGYRFVNYSKISADAGEQSMLYGEAKNGAATLNIAIKSADFEKDWVMLVISSAGAESGHRQSQLVHKTDIVGNTWMINDGDGRGKCYYYMFYKFSSPSTINYSILNQWVSGRENENLIGWNSYNYHPRWWLQFMIIPI